MLTKLGANMAIRMGALGDAGSGCDDCDDRSDHEVKTSCTFAYA